MSEESLLPKHFEQICRVCLSERKTLLNIFTSTIESSICGIPRKLMACAKIMIEENDNLPAGICLKCISDLNAAYEFQLLCEKSDYTLREVLQKSNFVEAAYKGSNNIPLEDSVNIMDTIKEEKPDWQDDNFFGEKLCASVLASPRESIDTDVSGDVKPERLRLYMHRKVKHGAKNSDIIDDFLDLNRSKRPYVRRKPLTEHKCVPCRKKFSERKLMVRHNLKVHGINMENEVKATCNVCKESFIQYQLLKAHEKQTGHVNKIKCDICNKEFSRSYLSCHMSTHDVEKSYLCSKCGKAFSLAFSFKKHLLYCTSTEKSFKCNECDAAFRTRVSLKSHSIKHKSERPFVCETCGKAFKRRTKLNEHKLQHLNIRPHICEICGKGFRQRPHLREHLRVHTGDRPFACKLCDASFTQAHCLKTHMKKHPSDTT